MYKVAIIIPIYNAEKDIKRLFNSIINQTMDFKDIQIIMIDDGSDDNTRNIIHKYQEKYDNVIGIELNTNHEVAGTARNEGIKVANSKYLMFADVDDFFMEDACEKMYNEIETKNADFITANYINADLDGTLWSKPVFDTDKYPSIKMNIKDYDESFYVLNSGVWNKIFRKSFIDKNEIKFLERLPAEDAYFTTTCFMKAKNVYYINDVVYCYVQNGKGKEGKTSISFCCDRRYFSKISTSYKAIYENFKENGHLAFYRYTYAKNMSYILYKFIDTDLLTDSERIDILKEMSWFFKLTKTLKIEVAQEAQKMIIDKIIEEDYNEAINYCKIIADIRKGLPKEINDKMSKPDASLYKGISKYDSEFEEG